MVCPRPPLLHHGRVHAPAGMSPLLGLNYVRQESHVCSCSFVVSGGSGGDGWRQEAEPLLFFADKTCSLVSPRAMTLFMV